MAIVWRKQTADSLYEVRTAGASLRLYTNGVFHSQFNPHRPLGGNLWDLFVLPSFFLEQESIKRVLVLGVGGGAVLRQLQHFFSPDEIVGVDIDPHHLYIARRFFGVKGKPFQLVCSDAVDWIKNYSGARFDLVIEDLYGEVDGEPVRAVPADIDWLIRLSSCVSSEGAVIMNFVYADELKRSAWYQSVQIRRLFYDAYRFRMDAYENTVAVFLRKATERKVFKKRFAAHPGLSIKNLMKYHMSRL